ncbi:TPA: hypothetical protein J2F82_003710 [Escherichia coli]|nr:hypothetical protein [Escherichia coli]
METTSSEAANSAFIVTHDHPPSLSNLKRLSLMNDVVYFSDLRDLALICDDETSSVDNGVTFKMGETAPYPRYSEYESIFTENLNHSEQMINERILFPINTLSINNYTPALHWIAYQSAIKDKELVRSASEEIPGVSLIDGFYSPFGVATSQGHSNHWYQLEQTENIEGMSRSTQILSQVRVGRALKSLSMASSLGANPVVLDDINSKVIGRLLLGNNSLLDVDTYVNSAIEHELLDIPLLEKELEDVPWQDILKMRRETLPAINKTRRFLIDSSRALFPFNSATPREIQNKAIELRNEYWKLKIEENIKWTQLGLSTAISTGVGVAGVTVTVGAGLFGLLAALIPTAGMVLLKEQIPNIMDIVKLRRERNSNSLIQIDSCNYLNLKKGN